MSNVLCMRMIIHIKEFIIRKYWIFCIWICSKTTRRNPSLMKAASSPSSQIHFGKAVDIPMNRLSRTGRFARWYLALGNVREAAIRAGCPPDSAAEDGLQMLHSAGFRRAIARLAEQPPLPVKALVTAGLTRLAFGDANDAARLVFSGSCDPDTLAGLDLFHVTGMKIDKSGNVEIRLADRLSAMVKLLECAGDADANAASAALLRALQGAAPLQEVDADDAESGELFP